MKTTSVFRIGEDNYEIESVGQDAASVAIKQARLEGKAAVLQGFVTPARSRNNATEEEGRDFHPLNLRTDNKFHLQKPVVKK